MIIKNRRETIRVLFCLMVLCLAGMATFAAEVPARADSLVVSGNQHYMNREYEKAIDCYTRVINMGYSASALYFNLGNAYYKQGDYPLAILYYEKARLLDPVDEDIKENLA